ncbi:MAG TPA: EamA family transporter [Terrimesophilobacter sp.]|uniref:DMT family transporter n=1 Tax=Terrimesophilobacter sp. TaxID=2906435 RepID=UPI002F950EB5
MRHVVFALIAAVCFGTTGTAQALGPDGAASLSVGSVRIVIGGAALALVAWLLFRRSATALRAPVAASGARRTWPVVFAGATAIVAYQPAFFLGTSLNGVAVGTVVAIGSGPIFTGSLEWALLRRFPGVAWLVATGIAVVGIVLLSGAGEVGATDATGLVLSLAAGACYAVYALSAKQLLLDGWTPTGSVALIFGWSAVGALPFLVLSDLSWLATLDGIVMALWLGIVTITVACLFLANGLKALRASTVATLGLGEPLTATLLGVIVLHEALSGRALIGLALVVVGLVLIGSLRVRRPVPA